ncbi:MAG: hypothetical protein M1813_006607 [Trichoglossum hirsutum]|nr:MAG: hypothetical protein M1813_006607 [Trichoglossum hirsutum]
MFTKRYEALVEDLTNDQWVLGENTIYGIRAERFQMVSRNCREESVKGMEEERRGRMSDSEQAEKDRRTIEEFFRVNTGLAKPDSNIIALIQSRLDLFQRVRP